VADVDRSRIACVSDDTHYGARIAAEFREMPGLRITSTQAARLFSLDVADCRRLLDALVSQGVLWAERGVFQVTGAGRRHA
jgi:hypothetical protein